MIVPGSCDFGTGLDVITPSRPFRVACTGAFADPVSDVHDDLFVRCLVVRSPAGRTLVLVSFDLLFHSRDLNDALAAHAATYGVLPADVVVTCVHNHNAPAVADWNPGTWDPAYEQLLREAGGRAIDRAFGTLRPGVATWAASDIDLNINRRVLVDGVAVAGPNETAPKDTELVTLRLSDGAGRLRALAVVWACHPVFYPHRTEIAAEWPGRLCAHLTARHEGVFAMFCQSAAGDVRPRDTVVDGVFTPLGYDAVDRFARRVADAVDTQLETPGEPLAWAIDGRAYVIELPLAARDRDYYEAIAAAPPALPGHPEHAHAEQFLADFDAVPHTLALHCTLHRLGGDVWLASTGGEPTYDIKQFVREVVPGRVIFLGYTDACAYIVSDRMLAEGGYECTSFATFGNIGPFAPGVDDRIRAGFAHAVGELGGGVRA